MLVTALRIAQVIALLARTAQVRLERTAGVKVLKEIAVRGIAMRGIAMREVVLREVIRTGIEVQRIAKVQSGARTKVPPGVPPANLLQKAVLGLQQGMFRQLANFPASPLRPRKNHKRMLQ